MDKKTFIKQNSIWIIGVILLLALICTAFFVLHTEPKSLKIMIVCFVIVVTLLCYLLFSYSHLKFHQFAFIVILIFCLLNSFIQPILNIPDEQAHLNHAETVSRGELFIDRHETTHPTIQSVLELTFDIEKPVMDSESAHKPINTEMTIMDAVAASHLFIYYLPQAFGIIIAKALDLDTIWMLWLARIMASIVYAAMAGLAIKITPKLKYFLFFILFLPMSIQQGGSVSVDIFVNGLSILFIAMFIKLYCESNHPKYRYLFLGFLALGLLLTFVKVTNVFICGLVLLLPMQQRFGKKSIWIKGISLLLFVSSGALFYYYTRTFGPVTSEVGTKSVTQLQLVLSDPINSLFNFTLAAIKKAPGIFSHLFIFGWYKLDLRIFGVFAVVLFIRQCLYNDEMPFSKSNRVLIVLMLIGIYMSTCFALFLSWTPIGSYDIVGVQGRYFIPLLALSGLLFTKKKSIVVVSDQRRIDMALALFIVAAMLIAVVGYYY